MKKIAQSLPVRLLAGVIIGIAVGLISNESFMNIIVTVKHLLGQVITFCVPLIVIGFIAPSITRLGKSASRMLSVALVLAYTSSVGAALFSMVAGYTPGKTATISTTVYQLWRTGDDALAFRWVLVNVAISAVVLLAVNLLERKHPDGGKRRRRA